MEPRCAPQPCSPRAPQRPPRHLGVRLPGPVSPRPAAHSLPLQPPSQELSSPRQLNQPPSSRVSSPSFVCARAELGRREKGEVALSVCLPPPLPGQLEVPPARREPGGGCGELAGRLGAARAPWSQPRAGERGLQLGLSWRHDSSAPAAPRPPSAPTYPRHLEKSVRRRRE